MSVIYRAALWLGIAAVGGLGIWGLWQHINTLEARANLAIEQRDQALARERQKDTVIDTLRTTAANLEAQRRAAAEQQTALERTASDRITRIETLQNENDELRDWARTRLPEPVVRMRERPAVTGAAAYHQSVRDAEPLHAAGIQPSQ